MTRILFAFTAATAAIFGAALLGAAPAFAQTRVFVSGLGSDSNPCSLGSPCRSFQQAHDTVLPGGEIVALDAAGYGPLNITKAVTVSAIGIEASITSSLEAPTPPGQNAITINAGASDVVSIRGLTLLAGSSSSAGVEINSAKSVTIRDTSISGFSGVGIGFGPQVGPLDLELRDVAANNNGTGLAILTNTFTGNLTLLVTGSTFNGNTNGLGIYVNGGTSHTVTATIADVTAAANSLGGIRVCSLGGPVVVMVTGSKLVNNTGSGLASPCGSNVTAVYVDRTQITGNTGMGWQVNPPAVINSYQNNEVNGNGDDNLNGVTQITSE